MARRASLAFESPRRIIASIRVRREATSANSAATKHALSATSRATAPSFNRESGTASNYQTAVADHRGHHHHHGSAEAGSRALAWALGITVLFTVVEAAGGLLAHS